MYEVYHWEAHPSRNNDSHRFREVSGDWWYQQPFTKPNGLEHRIEHHECYMKAYPEIKIPALVDDGPDGANPKLNTGCIVSKKFKASYTSVYVVGLDGEFLYISHWPPGPGGTVQGAKIWVDTTYKGLDKILTENMPTPIINVNDFSSTPDKILRIDNRGVVSVTLPQETHYSMELFNTLGKRVATWYGQGPGKHLLAARSVSGVYVAHLRTRNGTFSSKIRVTAKQ